MAKNLVGDSIGINIGVTADTSQAKAQLSSLQNTLKELSVASGQINTNLSNINLSHTIAQISSLQAHLQQAMNVDTGVLNFTKLNESIKQANLSLSDYGRTLQQLGPQGQQAFQQLASAVAKSEVPIGRANTILGRFGNTLKNTLRWQASSMLLHGTINSFQQAWNYAQKLNRSLTDIQIVTKQSDAAMQRFAATANKQAQALHVATTAYTDAALIYYQQGLNDKQVRERTDVTVKMSNVTGRTAEKVSDQMTAIWNNFDNGSKSLEYYADVITALGAATASSSDEIATGLSKFAAVADTVGLSYENATAALATITATTRQSADSVGNGLKTLFSRLQSLSLGQTLEDGVNLTKYTKALQTVGVSALDAAGNLRSMDSILADLGERWSDLSSAQQNALAQTVGGVRQYVTFTALMDNYDFFKKNIEIAKNSSGELQAQADIYAKSWEAARKNVRASAEAIYSDLIDDKFFTKLTNGFSGVLGIFDNFLDGLGGARGMLLSIGSLVTTIGRNSMTSGLQNIFTTVKSLTPKGQESINREREKFLTEAQEIIMNPIGIDGQKQDFVTLTDKTRASNLANDLRLQQQYIQNAPRYNELQKANMQFFMDSVRGQEDLLEQTRKAQETAANTRGNMLSNIYGYTVKDEKGTQVWDQITSQLNLADSNNSWINGIAKIQNAGLLSAGSKEITTEELNALIKSVDNETLNGFLTKFQTALENGGYESARITLAGHIQNEQLNKINNILSQPTTKEWLTAKGLDEKEFKAMLTTAQTSAVSAQAEKEKGDNLEKNIPKELPAAPYSFSGAQAIVEGAGVLANAGMALSMLSGLKDVWSNKDAELSDQLFATMTNGGFGVLMGMNALKSVKSSGLTRWLGEQSFQRGLVNQGKTIANITRDVNGTKYGIQSINELGNLAVDSNGKAVIGETITQDAAAAQKLGLPQLGWITAAIMAAGAAIYLIEDAWETPKERLESLQEQTELLQNAADEAKTSYDDLLTGYDQHNKLQENLSNLKVGTLEYRRALLEANSAANKLISTYGLTNTDELTSYYTDANGVIQLTEAGKQAITEQALTEAEEAQNKADVSQNFVKLQQFNMAFTDLMKDLNHVSGMYHYGSYDQKQQDKLDIAQKFIDEHPEYGYGSAQEIIDAYNNNTLGQDLYSRSSALMTNSLAMENAFKEVLKVNELNDVQSLAAQVAGSDFENAMNIQQAASYRSHQNILTINDKDINDIKAKSDILGLLSSINGGTASAVGAGVADFLAPLLYTWFQGRQGDYAGYLATKFTDEELKDLGYYDKTKGRKEIGMTLAAELNNRNAAEAQKEIAKQYEEQLAEIDTTRYEDISKLNRSAIMSRFGISQNDDGTYATTTATNKLEELIQLQAMQNIDKVLDSYYKIGSVLGATKFNKNLSLEDAELISITANNYAAEFGKQFGGIMLDQFSSNTDLLKKFDKVITGKNAIQDIQALQKAGYLSQNLYVQDRTNIAATELEVLERTQALMQSMGGDKGLFESLYGSEDFQNVLSSLQKEFEKVGEIGADAILEVADSSDTLKAALEITDLNAQGLATTLTQIQKGNLSIGGISEDLLQAYSIAGEMENSLAATYKNISDYEKGTSIDTIGNFYKNLESTIYKGVKNGNMIDEPVLNAVRQLFGERAVEQWRSQAAIASQQGSFTQIKDWMWNDSSFANQLDTIEKIYKTNNLQPLYEELLNGNNDAIQVNGETVHLSDFMRMNNGQVQTYIGDANGVDFLDAFQTEEEFIDYLTNHTELGKTYSPEIIRAMVDEYGGINGKNADLSQAWHVNGILKGFTEFLPGKSSTRFTLAGNNLANFKEVYGATLKDLSDEQITYFRQQIEEQLGNKIDTEAEIEQFNKLVEALKGDNYDELVNAMRSLGVNVVNLGEDFTTVGTSYNDLKNAYNVEGRNQGDFQDFVNRYVVQGEQSNDHRPGSKTRDFMTLDDYYQMYADLGFSKEEAEAQVDDFLKDNNKINLVQQVKDAAGNIRTFSYNQYQQQNPNGSYEDWKAGVTDIQNATVQADAQREAFIQQYQTQAAMDKMTLTSEEFEKKYGSAPDDYKVDINKLNETWDQIIGKPKDENTYGEIKNVEDLSDNERQYMDMSGVENELKSLNDKVEESVEYAEITANATQGINDSTTAKQDNANAEAQEGFDQSTESETLDSLEETLDQSTSNLEQDKAFEKLKIENTPSGGSTTQSTWTGGGGGGQSEADKRKAAIQQGMINNGLSYEQATEWYEANQMLAGSGYIMNTDGEIIKLPSAAASGMNNHIPGFASGYQGPATVGELGPEMWVHNGEVDIVGQQGRETVWVNPSDTIFTAGQTSKILNPTNKGFAGDGGGHWSSGYQGGSGGSGGKSRGGSGGKKEDDQEKWKDSWEPYHEISREVQRLTTDVENLNTEMERAFGVEKIQKMNEELELLDQRLQQEADYIAEAEKYIAEYEQYLPDGTEVVDGVIQNYDELQEKYLKDIYDAQEKRDKDKLERLQREWQRIQTYEQHTDKLEERRQEQLNLLYQKADLMLQQLQYSIDQVNSSLDESESLIEYMLNHMNTDMFKMAESIALVGDATDITIQKMEQAKQSIQDYEDMLGTEYANDEELVNSILQERNNLLKLNQELDKQRDNVIKKLTYTIQEFNNEQKKATKLLTNYNTLIKNYTDLSELMGLSIINNTEQIDKLNDALKNNMGLNIQATKSQLETNQAQIAQMEADFEANPWMREAYDDVYQKLVEEGQGLSVTLSNNLQSMLNFIVKEFETELDRALTSFQDQITKGFGTWDELTSAANSLKGAQDVNTKAYDRVYQLNTLIRDMDNYMNDMTSTKNHNSILKFQEQIKKLKADNTDQSQEELDVLRAQFELMQAQFDLEDAQNAKNQVRLQRDMNGNWGYVYTADEDAMAEAQQNVDDKLKAYLDAVTALQQVQGEYMGTVAELEIQEQELRNELNQLGHTDEDEERRAQLLKQIAELENQQNIYRQSLDRMEGSLNDAIEIGRNNINEIWDENVDLQAALKDLPMLILAGQQTTVEEFFDTLGKAEGKFIERTDAAKDAYMEQYEEWAPYLKDFNDGLGNMATQSEKAVENLDALNEQYLQEFTDAMKAAVDWEKEYGIQMQNIIDQNLEFIQSITDMVNGLREVGTIVPSISFRETTDTSQVAATIASMDSGGYTGAWGTSGKIAMLHEKEQVFNAQDTQNLLTAAQILRTIDASANSMAIGLNNMITPKIDGVAQQIDQNVSISASFPNVVNHLEIEEAFNNLTNKAMQYANRKNA